MKNLEKIREGSQAEVAVLLPGGGGGLESNEKALKG